MPTFTPFELPGLVLVTPDVHGDDRGFLLETWKRSVYERHGLDGPFVQDNHSRSGRGVVRGLHWQVPPHAQGKLVSVVRGEIFDVAVDLRRGSPSFGRWAGATLSEENHRQLWLPAGFAHGFCVRSDEADVLYKATAEYAPAAERSLRWNDPDLGIDWGSRPLRASAKDDAAPLLGGLGADDLFAWEGGAT